MADNTITTEIIIDGKAAVQTVGELRQQLNALQENTTQAGSAGEKALGTQWADSADKAAQKTGQLNNQLNALAQQPAQWGAISQVGQRLAAGMQAAAQNATLFAHAGLQAATGLQQLYNQAVFKEGLNSLFTGTQSLKQLDTLVSTAQAGFKALGGWVMTVGSGLLKMGTQAGQTTILLNNMSQQGTENIHNMDKAGADYAQNENRRNKASLNDWQSTNAEKLKSGQQLSQSLMALSDTVFSMELERAGSNQKARADILKKQFEANKAFQAADATINYLKGLVSIPASTPEPMATVEQAALTATYVASIAKIASAQFESTSTAALGAGNVQAASGVNLANVNTTLLRTQNQADATTQAPQPPIRVYVTESDITAVQGKVQAIKAGATFK